MLVYIICRHWTKDDSVDKITDLVYANGTQSYSYNSLLKYTDCKYRLNKNINK